MVSTTARRTFSFLPPLLFVVISFNLLFPLVSANIFPTTPVQSTVWLAGQPAVVTWSDDGTIPTADMMGPMVIELWENMSTFVSTLASNVNAKAGSAQVTAPTNVKDNTKYTVCFVVLEPLQLTVYSGDFTIAPAAAAAPNPPAPATPSPVPIPPSASAVSAGSTPSGVPPVPGSGKGPIGALPPVPTDPNTAAALALANWSAIATAMSGLTPTTNGTPNGHTRGSANGASGKFGVKYDFTIMFTISVDVVSFFCVALRK